MKIGVISDTHVTSAGGGLPAEVPLRLQAEGVALILHAGDLVHPRVLDLLGEIAEVRAVAGNMDPPVLRASLPSKRVETVDGVRIGIIHGSGPPTRLGERLLAAFDGEEIDALVFGHAHEPRNEICRGVLLFNPGSAAGTRGGGCGTFGILTVESGEITGEIVRLD